jgi:hypothetical protein
MRGTKLHTTRLCSRQSCPGASRYHAAFFIGHHGHNANGEPICSRHIRTNEIDASLFQPEQEMSVATQPVQLGDDQFRPENPTSLESLGQLRPICILAGLDLHKFLGDLPIAARSGSPRPPFAAPRGGEAGGGQFGSGSGAAAADKPADKPAKKKGKKIESRDEFVEKGVALRMRTRDAHRASATASPQ